MFNTSLLFALPFLVLFSSEVIYRDSIPGTLYWMTSHPNQFLLTYVILFGLLNIFYLLPRRIYISFGVLFLSILSVAGLVSRQKLLLRGEPLLPWDFLLGKEALNISQGIEGPSLNLTAFLIVIFIAVLILFSLFFIPKEKYHFPRKFLIGVSSLLLFFSLLLYIPLEKTFDLQLINWSQKDNYAENGMTLGFILNTRYMSVEEPGDYQKSNVKKVIGQTNTAYPIDQNFKPNVIFVMSEAFWDPTLLKEITFSKDPLPYFHSLSQKYTSGTLLSPVYGGGTANTEFEVLTGLSTKFLPQGVIPYVQFVHKPLEALPAIFKKQGYEATAIHTYDNWFYRRNLVYQDLGFDRFISKEFFSDPEYHGSYIRDTELAYKILQQIKQNDHPDFVYAVSMEAHGPYSGEENPQNSIKVSGSLKPQTKAILENYTNIIADVDQSLKILIEGLQEIKEPTIVVFFGDHLPMLGNDFDVYKEAGFFQDENSYAEYLHKYSVPLVVWDNFSPNKEDLHLSANFLGSYILERSKKEGSPLTDFLANLNDEGSNMITSAHYLNHERITDEELEQYRLLQYDVLLGNEYAYQLKPLHKPTASTEYILGEEPVTIQEVLIPDQKTIEVLGDSFSSNYQIYVNNEPISTNFVNNTLLTATLPENVLDKDQRLEIQVKLSDSMQHVISESNVYYYY